MILLQKKSLSLETFFRTIWVSTFLALTFSLPPLGILLAIHSAVGNIIMGVVLGFGIHFLTLGFSDNISSFYTRLMS